MENLSYLFGKPKVTGKLRSSMDDFKVFEQLPFEPVGEGEHVFIYLRKIGQNTVYIAKQLAKYFDVKNALVTYAGLKDRFAVTEQWFSVHLPGKQVYDLKDFVCEGVEVLKVIRHNKKLKTGALSGNRFEITLRDVDDPAELTRRWYAVVEHGVPNYFGEQRFGIDGNNIEKAKTMFAGQKVKDRNKRSIYLSAARSLLFNYLVDKRLRAKQFESPQKGDVMMLSGSQSVFELEAVDDIIIQRFKEKDVDITAALWGAGPLKSMAETLADELQLPQVFPDICQGLVKFGLKQERRRIRLTIDDALIDCQPGTSVVKLGFFLPSGCFATTVLRELLVYQDLTERMSH